MNELQMAGSERPLNGEKSRPKYSKRKEWVSSRPITSLRDARLMTNVALAKALGISKEALYDYLRTKECPPRVADKAGKLLNKASKTPKAKKQKPVIRLKPEAKYIQARLSDTVLLKARIPLAALPHAILWLTQRGANSINVER